MILLLGPEYFNWELNFIFGWPKAGVGREIYIISPRERIRAAAGKVSCGKGGDTHASEIKIRVSEKGAMFLLKSFFCGMFNSLVQERYLQKVVAAEPYHSA